MFEYQRDEVIHALQRTPKCGIFNVHRESFAAYSWDVAGTRYRFINLGWNP
jgi:hypothetical protein